MAEKLGKEEQKEDMRVHTRKAQDAFAAHLGTLDELLRESDELADQFVDCVNSREMVEDVVGVGSEGILGGEMQKKKRLRPPPPYWGSGFNRPNTNEEEDEDVESDSDFSEEEEVELYDDDNDDETFFDKVQMTTEQTLEALFHHIVK